MRWGLVWILALNAPRFFIFGYIWRGLARRVGQLLTLSQAIAVKWIGEAMSEATPLHVIGGDASRLALLHDGTGSMLDGSASIFLDRACHIAAGFLYSLVGVSLFLLSVKKLWFSAGTGLLVVAVICAVAVAAFRRFGIHPLILKGRRLFWQQRQALVTATIWCFVGKLLVTVELMIIFKYLALPLDIKDSFVLGAMGLIIVTVFPFLPSGLGAVEGGTMAFFHWKGLDPSLGLSLQLIRRLNGIFIILCGTLLLLFVRRGASRQENNVVT